MSNKNAYDPTGNRAYGSGKKNNGFLKSLLGRFLHEPTEHEADLLLAFQLVLIADFLFTFWCREQNSLFWNMMGSGGCSINLVLQTFCFYIAYHHLSYEGKRKGRSYKWQTIVSFIIGIVFVCIIGAAFGMLILILNIISRGLPDFWPWGIFFLHDDWL